MAGQFLKSAAGLLPHKQHKKGSLFSIIDEDGNGQIDLEEWTKAFDILDKDKGGSIDRDEWKELNDDEEIFNDILLTRKEPSDDDEITREEWIELGKKMLVGQETLVNGEMCDLKSQISNGVFIMHFGHKTFAFEDITKTEEGEQPGEKEGDVSKAAHAVLARKYYPKMKPLKSGLYNGDLIGGKRVGVLGGIVTEEGQIYMHSGTLNSVPNSGNEDLGAAGKKQFSHVENTGTGSLLDFLPCATLCLQGGYTSNVPMPFPPEARVFVKLWEEDVQAFRKHHVAMTATF